MLRSFYAIFADVCCLLFPDFVTISLNPWLFRLSYNFSNRISPSLWEDDLRTSGVCTFFFRNAILLKKKGSTWIKYFNYYFIGVLLYECLKLLLKIQFFLLKIIKLNNIISFSECSYIGNFFCFFLYFARSSDLLLYFIRRILPTILFLFRKSSKENEFCCFIFLVQYN